MEIDMNSYPNVLTPPSSNEDSQSMYIGSPNGTFAPQMFDVSSLNPSGAMPHLKILEQPVDRFRFRYKSEMTGTHGSLCGMNSDKSRKQTYPTVELCNFDKPAILRCSIYQYNVHDDNMPHAHRLVKKHGKDEIDDPHNANVSSEEAFQHVFHSMGIIHTAKKNLVPELIKKKTQLKREEIARKEGKPRKLYTKEEVEIKAVAEAESKSINLNVVCLRFDAFYLHDSILYPICDPVYSHGINNLKSALTGELKIVRMDHCTSPTKGGAEIYILVERVTKKNIKVRFFELDDDENLVWEDYGKFSDLDVHHQYAIVFKTPPYRSLDIPTDQVKVFIQLERPSDQARSEPREFTYIINSMEYKPGAKRSRPNGNSDSFNSFNLASSELPVVVNDFCLKPKYMMDDDDNMAVNSDDLTAALNNIGSEEFRSLFNNFGNDYLKTVDSNNTVDGVANIVPASIKGRGGGAYIVRQPVNQADDEMTQRTYEDLFNFIKTRPKKERVVQKLGHHLGTANKTNALHIAIKQNNIKIMNILLKIIICAQQPQLLNVKNSSGETPLHIAVQCNNDWIVQQLVLHKADPTLVDSNLNTVLHLAAINPNIQTELISNILSSVDIRGSIDAENNEGDTALTLAIESENVKVLKLLCAKGADINKQHKKQGYTPLRLAIERQNIDMIKYILYNLNTDPLIEDFQGLNPLQVALVKCSGVVYKLVSDYVRENNLFLLEIKREINDDSDDEIEQKFKIKLEELSPDEIRENLSKVKRFTPDCLDRVSEILDQSGNWASLADLLDLSHLMRADICADNTSPSKFLLNFAIDSNGDNVLQVRDFLENLDEFEAVRIIDKMVNI